MYERVWRVQGSKVLGAIYSHWGWCHSRVAWDGFSLEAAQCKYKLFLYIPFYVRKTVKVPLGIKFYTLYLFSFSIPVWLSLTNPAKSQHISATEVLFFDRFLLDLAAAIIWLCSKTWSAASLLRFQRNWRFRLNADNSPD